jgi:hypothetical protein
MDGLRRVTFRFGRDMDVRYLPAIPEPGELVTRRDELWVVSHVSDDAGGTTVVCDLQKGNGRDLRVA